MSEGAVRRFHRWFADTMANADGNFGHMPAWLKNHQRIAYLAGYEAGKKAREDNSAAATRVRMRQQAKRAEVERYDGDST